MSKYCVKVCDIETGRFLFQIWTIGRALAVSNASILRNSYEGSDVRVYTGEGKEVSV